jgi:hypothetical protein
LQAAYNGAPTAAPHILTTAANPIRIQALVAGPVLQIRDTLGANIFEVDDTFVEVDGQFRIVDAFTNHAAQTSMTISDTFTTGQAYIGGGVQSNGTVTYNNATFIWALLAEQKIYRAAVSPAFAAFTLFNVLARIENLGNFDLVQALVLNNGLNHRRNSSGTSTVIQTIGLSDAPQTQTTVSGAVLTRSTGVKSVSSQPTFSTVAGSTVNLGTLTALHVIQPAQAIFGSSAGTENITARIGLDWVNHTFGGALAVSSVVRSNQASGTNRRFLNHTGTAESTHVGNLNMLADFPNGVIRHGLSSDYSQGYIGATNELFCQIVTPATTQWRWSAPSAGRLLLQGVATILDELNINVSRFSMGASSGAVGNQVGNFVAGARTVSLAGEWSDFLLTQAANITVDAAMGLVAGWTVNAPSITLGTGTVTTAGVLNVGGNVNQGSVNRFGIRVLSNPSGGSGVNAALWITAGRSRFDGIVDLNQPIALGGGAAATLGTIGGSGPTAAAQAQWVQIEVNGVNHWIPAWT